MSPRLPPGRHAGALLVVPAVLMLLAGGCADLEQATSEPEAASTSTAAVPVAKPAASSAPAQKPAQKPAQEPKSTPAGPPVAGTAASQLATLVVAGRAPMTGYDRGRFGQAWLDADRNGCDTRNDILRRDLRPYTLKPNTGGCVVLTGVLADPYTGTSIDFVRGDGTLVDIDHVVALGNAWASGAWRFDVKTRAALANDPLNLLAVDAGANRQKGDANAASWLPAVKAYRCAYVARQIAVKSKYHLAVIAAEKAQMARQLATCPGRTATPDPTGAPTRVDQNITDPGDPDQAPTESSDPGGGGPVYYRNCDAARAAGAAPVHEGDPGYGRHLDRDGDGTGCE